MKPSIDPARSTPSIPFSISPDGNRSRPPESSSTQRERIYNLLVCAQGDWVALPEITKLASQYGARIHELRRLGFRIENRTKEIAGVRHSWFRLVSDVSKPSLAAQSAGIIRSISRDEETLPLFPTGGRS